MDMSKAISLKEQTMTDAQATHRLNTTLKAISRSGDRDEKSLKHICHALAAIINGKSWTDGVDYSRPWDWEHIDNDDTTTTFGRNWNKKLADRWAKVEALRDELGTERFHHIVDATEWGASGWDYVNTYIDRFWSAA